MARFVTEIESVLPPDEAFAYMADFSNARVWDPGVSRAERLDEGPIRVGSAFDVVARFAGRDVQLRYEIVEHAAPSRVVLEARRPGFVSRDTITVTAAEHGCVVRYDALLEFAGLRRLFDPMMQRMFNGVGADAEAGMREALNP
jgi:hypothetical protein